VISNWRCDQVFGEGESRGRARSLSPAPSSPDPSNILRQHVVQPGRRHQLPPEEVDGLYAWREPGVNRVITLR
jgi:hypothetical protein